MLLLLIYIFVAFGVVSLAGALGGRYERIYAAIVLVTTVVSQAAQSVLRGSFSYAVVIAVMNLCAWGCLIWLYRRHRAPWVTLQLLGYTVSIPIDWTVGIYAASGRWGATGWGLWWVQSVLVYLQLVILTCAVLRRHLGPPYPVPQKLQAARAG